MFIQHPQAVFKGQIPARAKICDAQWSLLATLCHRSSQFPNFCERNAHRSAPSADADKDFWSNEKQDFRE